MVQSATRSALALKRYRKNSSSSSLIRRKKRSIEFTADDHFSPAMLPLVSTTMPRLTGVRSALKCVTSTGLLSS